MKENQKNPKVLFGLMWGILFILCFIAGYGLSELLFSAIDRPSALWVYLICVCFSLTVLTLALILINIIIHRVFKNGKQNDRRNKFLDDMTDALNKIARGNFDVLISTTGYDMPGNDFTELAKSVNKMAKELRSMENLRQDFISNVSHEIQSPLTSISGFAALLKNENLSAEQRNHYLDVIETESKRLSKLSDNLLKLSALESDDTSFAQHEFRMDKQIESALLMLEPQWAKKNINLDVSLEKLTFTGDEELLTQVWVNLLHNAVKFTPMDGSIHITLTENENDVCCMIADNGIGISEEDQIHIFEHFYKADKSRDRALGGNGLGLSLVKKIVDMHKGQIIVKSEMEKGTEFIVTLPNNI